VFRIICIAFLATAASQATATEPLRLANGEPMVCIYYFDHWWEPWRSDDNAVLDDLRRLRKMGFSTLLVDHEWTQAIDNDWRWLDRTFGLADQAGMYVVPWLSVKTLCDVDPGNRASSLASGLGFYSWNEMGDWHVAYSGSVDRKALWKVKSQPAEKQASELAVGLMRAIAERYANTTSKRAR